MEFTEKQRIIQEFVPGKQITLAHLISHPNEDLFKKLGVVGEHAGSLGIMTITPSEGAIVAADIADKAANVTLAFVDRFSGSLIFTGSTTDVEAALEKVVSALVDLLGFTEAPITKT